MARTPGSRARTRTRCRGTQTWTSINYLYRGARRSSSICPACSGSHCHDTPRSRSVFYFVAAANKVWPRVATGFTCALLPLHKVSPPPSVHPPALSQSQPASQGLLPPPKIHPHPPAETERDKPPATPTKDTTKTKDDDDDETTKRNRCRRRIPQHRITASHPLLCQKCPPQ